MAQALDPVRILVTGFGAFPGTRSNPTVALVRTLEKDRPRLARLGIELALEILPVVYAEIAPRLEALTKAHRPDAILHLGLAVRRKSVSLETRAVNRASLLHPDASGATAARLQILPSASQSLRSTFPAVEIATALERAGIASRLSNNAGKYICNQTLYLSLAHGGARQVGFIHVPHPARRNRRGTEANGSRPTLDDLTRAAIVAILVMARSSAAAACSPCRHRLTLSHPWPSPVA
jgi:Pyrrolidone-carboxylate peptidase (N-terminal pyroglutamyl peptidase)